MAPHRNHGPKNYGALDQPFEVGEDAIDIAPSTSTHTPESRRALREGLSEPVGSRAPAQERFSRRYRLEWLDWPLLSAVIALTVLGSIMLVSVNAALDSRQTDTLWRQGLAVTLGAILLCGAALVDYRRWKRLAFVALLGALGALMFTTAFGRFAHGATRWIDVIVSIQPSEFAKLALALFLASYLTWRNVSVRRLSNYLIAITAVAAVAVLALAQRDMGTTVIILLMAFSMLFAAGAQLRHFLPTLAAAIGALVALAITVSYRRSRITAFLQPISPGCHDAGSYQICQGLLSLGSGGVFGAGLGDSIQKTGYLPFPETDSIFAVLGGELGLIGSVGVLVLFSVIAWRGYRAGRRAPDQFGAILAAGLTTWLVSQAAVNIGSVVSAIPFTGVPLTFISRGGSAMVAALIAVGLLLNISALGHPPRRVSVTPRHTSESTGETIPGRKPSAKHTGSPIPVMQAGMRLAGPSRVRRVWSRGATSPPDYPWTDHTETT